MISIDHQQKEKEIITRPYRLIIVSDSVGSMKMTENKQRRLKHYIGAPKRFLRRARDFYVDSLVSFDGKVSSANIVPRPPAHVPRLPKNFATYASTKMDNDEDPEELYRSMSSNYNWSSMECDKSCPKQRVSGYSAMDRSYSVALGKIGTIDEEEPCDFQEHVVMKSEMMFPRSRSHAVTRNNGFY